MDNLCHTLVGAALAEAGLARRKPLATATMLIGANLSDVDGFTYAFLDGPTSLEFRRGWTHGILAMAVLPLLLAAAMVGFDQMVRRRRRTEKIRARFRSLLVPAFVSVLSHPLLDFLNTYGVRFLFPFSKRWFYGDTLFIVDPWVWVALALGVGFSRAYRNRSPTLAVAPARIALGAVAGYVAIMMASSFAGRIAVRRAAAAAGLEPPSRVLVAPVPVIPWRRLVVLERPEAYRYGTLLWTPGPKIGLAPGVTPRNESQPAVEEAIRRRRVRQFLVWARFPYFDVRKDGDTAIVTAGDARYPGPGGGWAAVTEIVSVKPAGPAPPMSSRN